MGILPHTDVEKALELYFSLDIPFWPQLPRLSFYEDMYTQVSETFPGIVIEPHNRELWLSWEKFYEDLEEFVAHWDDRDYFALSPQYSAVFHRFLSEDLSGYPLIRGQSTGLVSYGLKILDENKRSIIYYEEVREIMFEFILKKVEVQYEQLKEENERAFVWVYEPGLEMVFMAFTGYTEDRAFRDYQAFLERYPGPKGAHLCGNPDWSFLLQLDLNILSVDVLAWGHIFSRYVEDLKSFLDKGGIISWGITPTLTKEFEAHDFDKMIEQLDSIWGYLEKEGVPRKQILS